MTTTMTNARKEFGMIYEGVAEPIQCADCGAVYHCEENLRRHWRVHRRRGQ